MNLKKTDYVKDTDELHLHCPICNFEYTHLQKVHVSEGGDDEKRLAVTLELSCEKGHQFQHYIHNHKGYTLITNEEVKRPS